MKILVEIVGLLVLRGQAQVGSSFSVPFSRVFINDKHLLLQVFTAHYFSNMLLTFDISFQKL